MYFYFQSQKTHDSFAAHDPRPSVRPRAGHVLLITWVYVSVVVVGYTYSSQLTASLTVQEVSPPFSSLQQLVSQDTYTWGVAGGAGLHSILQVRDLLFQWAVCLTKSYAKPEVSLGLTGRLSNSITCCSCNGWPELESHPLFMLDFSVCC